MSFDIAYLRIKRIIGSEEECFLCALEDEIENKYIDTYLSELVMDALARQKIIESKGFCNHHFYKMLIAASKPATSDGHGMALLAESITGRLLKDLKQKKSNLQEEAHYLVPDEDRCPACIHLLAFMQTYYEKTEELIASKHEEFLELYKKSKGLCIPHFAKLIYTVKAVAPNQRQQIIQTITDIEEKGLLHLESELAEYIKKQSYEFSEKDRAAVADVVLRSVKKISGRRGIKFTVKR